MQPQLFLAGDGDISGSNNCGRKYDADKRQKNYKVMHWLTPSMGR
jgi:hypothetical protein